MKSEKTCANPFDIDWSRLPGVACPTNDRHDIWTLICPLSWDAYGSGGDPRKEPEQTHVPVQLSADLELGCGVGPPHCIPVDWRQSRKNWFKKKKTSGLDKLKGYCVTLLTCNIYFSVGQRSQVRRGESVKAPSIHLGHAIPSVQFVVKIQADLSRKADVLLKRAKTWHLFNINMGEVNPLFKSCRGKHVFVFSVCSVHWCRKINRMLLGYKQA